MIGVKVEISRGAVKRGITVEQAGEILSSSMIGHLGTSIRERVEGRGDLGGQTFPGWSTKRTWFAVSPRYPDRARGKLGPSGAERYPSRAEYHGVNGTRPGSYHVTGGMWSGLSAVVPGRRRGELLFRGRSEGQNPNFFKRGARRGRNATPDIVARGLRVDNNLKAWSVLSAHRVNVLAISHPELHKIRDSAVLALSVGVSGQMPAFWGGAVPSTVSGAMRVVWG